jgi:Penicillin binding protein transpeptidase domain/Penicillin-binding Protein dimerisation domain/NTF2-like N-terminal transpeptidase domain
VNTSNGHRRRARRALPVLALATVAFALGAILGAGHRGSPRERVVAQFAKAWTRGDYATMYEDIDDASRRAISPSAFRAAYGAAARTATETGLAVKGRAHEDGDGTIVVGMRVRTRVWGAIAGSLRVKVSEGAKGPRVVWDRALVFPGLRAGETLSRHTALPPRATLLARDGSVLAEGSPEEAGARSSPLGAVGAAVVGDVGTPPQARRAQLEAAGVPSGAIVGVSGLELALDDRLRGRPGGELLAGGRVLASAEARQSGAVRTTISPDVQRAAVEALGGQLGGIVALDPASGGIEAVAGIGTDDLQPPGSTFKMVTLTAALEAKVAREGTVFPYATSTTLDGVKLENANGESCGGSLALAFAVSCNSVFAPLGVKVGAARLVATAERFGFNEPPGMEGAVESTLPQASRIQGELDVGATAIGQGQVQASALQMARVAATIADGGRRPTPSFEARHDKRPRVVAAATARTVRRLMIDVVREGTGTAAAIPGVVVAGKTGTAELGTPRCAKGEDALEGGEAKGEESEAKQGKECASGSKDPQNTDAWFAAFAPALHPRIAVGVLLVKDGAGGETAAPVARQVLEAGLR